MAKQRYIDTRFWHDNFIREKLNPLDRYLFLYFLTNDKTNICGAYELPLSMIASETGLDTEMIKKMIKRLKGKVEYIDGWVIVKNFIKYQNYKSPKIQKGIEVEFEKLPENIKNQIPYLYGIDTISHSNSNTNTNSNADKPTNDDGLSFKRKKENDDLKEVGGWVDIDFQSEFNKSHRTENGKWVVRNKKGKKLFYVNKKFYEYIIK